jgi:hypothetical protein
LDALEVEFEDSSFLRELDFCRRSAFDHRSWYDDGADWQFKVKYDRNGRPF